ncbi:hypothetical protein M3C36_11390 [Dietzia cinnamea]|uniref:DUF6882 domain-containing protein n=1 Tax=Dietzia TaxID=37914 RepID=UPI000D08B152|nr:MULTISPECIES: DUF6882 domain-containing protein [Dietzia]AVM66176.1 hypothetical protein C3V38_16610 [Dietzia sp. oral taxon 368]MCT1885780.1 hypothetical protein [Dietzia cinnamea]MCT2301365.1 hypothetical protein [Dietzia cinnamea]
MATTAPPRRTLDDAVDRGLLFAHEHQLHFVSLVGATPRWRLIPTLGTSQFEGRRSLDCDTQIIGVVKAGTWEWAWASPNVTRGRQIQAEAAYRFGQARNMPVFTTPRLELEAGDARRLVIGASSIHRWWTSFAFGVDGMVMHGALRHPALELPDPTPATVRQTLDPSHWTTAPHNARRAIRSYATLRKLTRQERRDRTAMRLSWANQWQVTAHFTADGALEGVTGD